MEATPPIAIDKMIEVRIVESISISLKFELIDILLIGKVVYI